MVGSDPLRSVARDAPLRLSVAAQLAFPDGSMTASGLRREAARGRLRIERIANKDFTSLQAIDEMRKLCRVQQKAPDSGCAQSVGTPKKDFVEKPAGSSSTTASISPQVALRMKL